MVSQHVQSASIYLSLPSELIELTLVFAAASDFPDVIATVAQTCRAMRLLVYGAADQHLWREIFLTTFDDPRAVYNSGMAAEPDAIYDRADSKTNFDWGSEYRRRVWAANYLRRSTLPDSWDNTRLVAARNNPEVIALNLKALETLLMTIQTALPFPSPFVYRFITDPLASRRATTPPHPFPTYPTFPPSISTAGHSAQGEVDPYRVALVVSDGLGHGITSPSSLPSLIYAPSRNIAWLEKQVSRGFPPDLTRRISNELLPGGYHSLWPSRLESDTMLAFGRLIASTGFIAIPQDVMNDTDHSSTDGGDHPSRRANSVVDETSEPVIQCQKDNPSTSSSPSSSHVDTNSTSEVGVNTNTETPDSPSGSSYEYPVKFLLNNMTITAQRSRARRIARMRVYNMRYLRRERHWGPYLFPSDDTQTLEGEIDPLGPIQAMFLEHEAGHPSLHDDDDNTDDDDDESYRDDGDSSSSHGGSEHEDDAEDDGPTIPPLPAPGPDSLRADWHYLSAVRIVVEANLQESVDKDELKGLMALDGLRLGSLPIQAKPPGVEDEEEEVPDWKGKGRVLNSSEEHVDGSDWAGVTGVWRRCICWMDYRDLILQNLSGQFNDPSLQEAVRIVPMLLRIDHFTAAEVPKYRHRPTIHVVGDTAGPAGSSSVRKIRGSIGMIADGSVRWRLNLKYSSASDEDGPDEWVSEGVQIGDATSAIGVLGMWTGAEHERMDPLGPFWAWKVG